MKLKHGLHLAYCTNIHRGETWAQTFDTLQRYTLAVRDRVGRGQPYAIGLRLGAAAATELSARETLRNFRQWLEREQCYVFTINGFPYGQFHGTRVKEQVYAPDWTTRERVDYTNLLFDLLAELLPDGMSGSVSTVPVSYKEFMTGPAQVEAAAANLWSCLDHLERLCARTGRDLHLGLEPEPLCFLETSVETVQFFALLRRQRPGDDRWQRRLGVNYDCCHLAVEFEAPRDALRRLQDHGIRISKIHLSSALRVEPTPEVRVALESFADDIYFHQVIARGPGVVGNDALKRYRDLDVALAQAAKAPPDPGEEWRIHFHIPLHSPPTALYGNTQDHIAGVLAELRKDPGLCQHFEMETYTWEVMPPELKKRDVVEQLVAEYAWTLSQLRQAGLAQ